MCVNGLGHFGPFLVASLSSQCKFPTIPIAAGRCLGRLFGMELFSGNILKSSYFGQEASTGGLHGKSLTPSWWTLLTSKFFGVKKRQFCPSLNMQRAKHLPQGLVCPLGHIAEGFLSQKRSKWGNSKAAFPKYCRYRGREFVRCLVQRAEEQETLIHVWSPKENQETVARWIKILHFWAWFQLVLWDP